MFTNGLGHRLYPTTVSHGFVKLVRRLGLPITLHGQRHVPASVLLQEGVPLKIVSERPGHSSTVITSAIYSRVARGLGRAAAQAFDRA